MVRGVLERTRGDITILQPQRMLEGSIKALLARMDDGRSDPGAS